MPIPIIAFGAAATATTVAEASMPLWAYALSLFTFSGGYYVGSSIGQYASETGEAQSSPMYKKAENLKKGTAKNVSEATERVVKEAVDAIQPVVEAVKETQEKFKAQGEAIDTEVHKMSATVTSLEAKIQALETKRQAAEATIEALTHELNALKTSASLTHEKLERTTESLMARDNELRHVTQQLTQLQSLYQSDDVHLLQNKLAIMTNKYQEAINIAKAYAAALKKSEAHQESIPENTQGARDDQSNTIS